MSAQFDAVIGETIIHSSPSSIATISRKADLYVKRDGIELLFNRLGDGTQLTIVGDDGQEETIFLGSEEIFAVCEYLRRIQED